MPPIRHRHAQYATRGPVPQDLIDAVDFVAAPLRASQALVEVLAAPINPSDLLTLTGDYGSLPPLPAIGGNEGIGRVIELGAESAHLEVGARVLLPVGCGTWTTHVVAEAAALLPLPDEGDALQLSMLAINPPTASLLLSEFVDLPARGWVIQNAANSAVGGYLVQLARARGLRTVNVVRRESARAAVEASGADIVLLDGDDLATRVREATTGAEIALGIDAVGGMATERLAQCLVPGSTLVNYGAMGGEACQLSPASLIFRGVQLRGFWLARWFRTSDAATQRALFADLAAKIADGTLSARIGGTYGIDDIRAAVAAAAAGGRDGKIIVVPCQAPGEVPSA